MSEKTEQEDKGSDLEELEALIKKQETEIENKQQEIQEIKDQLLRMQADFDNYRKQSEKRVQETVQHANEELIIKILDPYEDLQRALESDDSVDIKKGVELIYQNLQKILESEGLEEIPADGEKFDPYHHEALMAEDHEDFDEGCIIQELIKGYKLNSKVIKYSKVKVCKKR